MGDRGHVVIHDKYSDAPVVLYTHWQAHALPEIVARALSKQARWRDPEYLARIICDEISAAAGSETTGAGIGTELHGDVWRVVDIDTVNGVASFRILDDAFRADEHAGEWYEFRDFIEEFGDEVALEALEVEAQ